MDALAHANEIRSQRARIKRDLKADYGMNLQSTKEIHMKSQVYRQGDVLIERVGSIPEGLKGVPREAGRVILAHGEVTGHAHAIVSDKVEFLAADLADLEERFLRVEAEVDLVHEEHATITLPPGEYSVRIQREYAPAASVYVAD
jgi:hypothetical protein